MNALKFWTALLFIFAGAMILLLATGRLGRENGDQLQVVVTTDDAHSEELETTPQGDLLVDFELQDQAGKPFDSKSLEGKVWVGSVFFSSCPSTCRIQNMRVAELQKEFGDLGVEFVSVTCDPARDTVAKLNEYSKLFNAEPERWHFLTGDFPLIQRIGVEKFGIVVQEETHSDRLVLFNRDGSKVGTFRSTQAEDFAKLKQELTSLTQSASVEQNDDTPAGVEGAASEAEEASKQPQTS